jgi:hypothetical protein
MAEVPGTLLDQAVPSWDVRERHHRDIAAPVETVWRAVLDLTVGELPVTHALMRVRTLGRVPPGAHDRRLVDALPPGEVARREPTELLFGLVSPTSWRKPMSAGPALQPATTAELARALPDGWVRVGMDFRLHEVAAGTRLATETRIVATGPRARRVFSLYWLAIRAGSAATRREMLRAIARRAEATGG